MMAPEKELPMAGEVFRVGGRAAFLISPAQATTGGPTPWVWYAPTLPGLPGPEERWMFERFLAAGMGIAGIDVGESYGNPPGCSLFSALYEELTERRGLYRKACLLARSRGGLMLYNWAVGRPSAVACVAGIYPVCNLSSYPGLAKACGAYGLDEAAFAARLAEFNPIDRIEPLAKAGAPIFHVHGDQDTLVPLDQNSAELAGRYRRFGGEVTLRVVEGQGHNRWPGWFQCQELVDFVIASASASHRREGS
jgi:pimeloyl-ACP methyl ester carboxylesterase